MLPSILYHIVFRIIGLHHRPPGKFIPARPAADLGNLGKGPLIAAVIVNIHGGIRGQHSGQRHFWKIQPFRHHLGADENVNPLIPKGIQNFFMSKLFARRVHIHTDRGCLRKQTVHFLLDFLRPGSESFDIFTAAFGTGQVIWNAIVTVVANQLIHTAVIRQADVTVGTFCHVSAHPAADEGGVSSPVQKQDGLLLPFQILSQFLLQFQTEGRKIPVFQFLF